MSGNGDITFTPLVGLTSDSTPAPYTADGYVPQPTSVSIDYGNAPMAYTGSTTVSTVSNEICEVANPTNCATASVSISVFDCSISLIDEIKEDLTSIHVDDLAITSSK